MPEVIVRIRTSQIALDAFLKWAGVLSTGGQAKLLIASGAVSVNGQPESRRGRRLVPGDLVQISDQGSWRVSGCE